MSNPSFGRLWRVGRPVDLARLTASEVRIGPRARAVEAALQPKQRKKLQWWILRLKQDAFAGDQIPKDRIPNHLAVRSGLSSALTNAWIRAAPCIPRCLFGSVR